MDITSEDVLLIYSVISTVISTVFAYLWHRRKEVYRLAIEISRSYNDETITKDEFIKICERLSDVIFKNKTTRKPE